MPTLAGATVAVAYGFFGALTAIVVTNLLTGGINLRGLLRVKLPGGAAGVSPARVQLLVATIAVAANYLSAVFDARASGHLPEVNTTWLAALGASHGVYLASKLSKFNPILDALRRVAR